MADQALNPDHGVELAAEPKPESTRLVDHIDLLGEATLFFDKALEAFPGKTLGWLRCRMIDNPCDAQGLLVQIHPKVNRFTQRIRDLLRTNFGGI